MPGGKRRQGQSVAEGELGDKSSLALRRTLANVVAYIGR